MDYAFNPGQLVKFQEYAAIGYGRIVRRGNFARRYGEGKDYIVLVTQLEKKSPWHDSLQIPGEEIEIWERNMQIASGQLLLNL